MQVIENYYAVHKFGGSSVANAERFVAIKSLLSGTNEVVIVSAIFGTTSSLQAILDAAKSGEDYESILDEIEKLHLSVSASLCEKSDSVVDMIKHDINELKSILYAVKLTGSYSPEIQNIVLGFGELWSSKILHHYLSKHSNVLYLDASTVLFIFEKNGMVFIDWERSSKAINAFLKDKSFDQIVIPGFIASTLEGKRTTLGRNGSDFSAAIFSKLFKAKSLTIWTDVDGIFTADPNRVQSAFVIDSLSYQEALELAYFGAKILHPMTIAPAQERNIAILIKNSFNPEAKGTCISAKPEKSEHVIKGLTVIDDVALVNVEGAGMTGVTGIASRIFQVLHQENISVILIAQASSEHSICFAISRKHAAKAEMALKGHLQLEIENKNIQKLAINDVCGILSAVGDGMIGVPGVSGKLFNSLAKANVNIRAISQGSSERNISVVINSQDINKALQAVHAGFYLSRESISIGVIGPGIVGSALLSQINEAIDQLRLTARANIFVRGIMNSRKMLLARHEIDLSNWQQQLDESDIEANLDEFANHILVNDIPHAVIIDCTASQKIADKYANFLEKGIHVITPNKHANAGNIEYYKKLKSLTEGRNQHYLYEATVCAGLPVINTLQDILRTGDHIEKIEGIVSGTLSYIFNELGKNRKFSEIVREAKKKGYTEPDPRQDLSGMDVARKLVCLVREMGFDKTLDDVKVHDLVPDDLKSCSIDEFLEKLSSHDNKMMKLADEANANNKKVCYVGTIFADGSMHVAMEAFSKDHAFSRMQGTDNMLVFHTKRYSEQPLIIQGPGAGAEVTAAGIFADLLRLLSYFS